MFLIRKSSAFRVKCEDFLNVFRTSARVKKYTVIITINVPLFKKLRDIIFFWWDNHFMSHFEGHFEGAKTFLTP